MGKKHTLQAVRLTEPQKLQTLVENRSVYTLNHCELNVFETHRTSRQVSLRFDYLVYTAMLRGKKVMHLPGKPGFEYLPGESVMVPENEEMLIDFPEADLQSPTQCLALAIDQEKIKETLDLLNEKFARPDAPTGWQLRPDSFHFQNSLEITDTLNRLVRVSRGSDKAKDIFVNLTLQELLIRLMQTQARHLLFDNYRQYLHSHRFAFVVGYIREHLTETLTIEKLSDLACMSQPHFFRSFKREFGLSPVEFVIKERLKIAKKHLADPLVSIAEAGFRSGFRSLSHFATLFKRHEGTTPGGYRQSRLSV